MFAVIKTGGKQYKVAADDVITVEKLGGEAGDKAEFVEVLMIGDGDTITVGAPFLKGAKVLAEVVEHNRDEKITIIKKKRRNTYRRKQGHRQHKTVLKITSILAA